jgi:hypothetical protein
MTRPSSVFGLASALALACMFVLGCAGEAASDTAGTGESGATGSDSASSSETADASESGSETSGDGDGDGDPGGPLDDLLTLDHVQVKGTHNSYHIAPEMPFDASHVYTHPPLDVQLEDFGVRAFELDLHRNADFLLVYHIQVIDAFTTCNTLKACLTTIGAWSDQHPGHVPIMVWLEIKDSTGGEDIDDLLLVDQTILEVLAPEHVLTPDFVRGDHASLREAIETDGWPTLGEVRGKIMFMILNGDHPSVANYVAGPTSLAGRLMFVDVDDYTLPYAAVSKINDPASPNIAAAHAAGILTASNICGAGSTTDACIASLDAGRMSGTHQLMDDFLAPVDGMTYFLDLPDGNPARCNEVTAPPECTSAAIEDLP